MSVLMPHLEVDAELVHWQPWIAKVNGSAGSPVGEQLDGWDYSTKLTFSRSGTVDVDRVLEQSGIPDAARLGVYLKVDCKHSDYMDTHVVPLSEVDEEGLLEATIEVPPGHVAADVRLEAGIVLLADGRTTKARAARKPGSILLRARHSLRLEGVGGRMAIELSEFPAEWAGSPWRVQIDYDEFAVDSFARSTVLLVNNNHPAADEVLNDKNPQFTRVASLIKADIVRAHLLRVAVAGTPMVPDADEGSVAHQLEIYSELIFASSLADVIARVKSDPEDVEVVLKSHFKYLGEAS